MFACPGQGHAAPSRGQCVWTRTPTSKGDSFKPGLEYTMEVETANRLGGQVSDVYTAHTANIGTVMTWLSRHRVLLLVVAGHVCWSLAPHWLNGPVYVLSIS
jgi:hypothetical protein